MTTSCAPRDLDTLAEKLTGELYHDSMMRTLYATDASEYQELPAAVALPKTEDDLRELIHFANKHRLGLIPRAAGTSLAGQVVGNGIVVDIGRHLNQIVAVDLARRCVRVQPGVVRNELNLRLAPDGLFFPPETSTANRAMIGGMVGNNSCGANSIVYGTTREHLVSARGLLSDGSEATFGPLTTAEFNAKCDAPTRSLEREIYRTVRDLLGDPKNRQLIRDNFPKPSVTRRNTGYALDRLMECMVFDPASATPFNLCRLIAGSEGTLFFGVEFELNVEPLPPPGALLCAHFKNVDQSLRATLIAMRHKPSGCELIDRQILECTKGNLEQSRNRFFVQGDPGAILVVEVRDADRSKIEATLRTMEAEMRAANLGFAYPVLWGDDCNRVWDLRRAGQGLMNNVDGDAKPRENVEDTAVAVEDLPDYIAEFDAIMRSYGIESVYYAHAGAGELHTRPLFDLKTEAGLKLFREIATKVAALVKKYRGSLSGEHGDGRLRGEFIKFMVGEECYAMMRQIKQTFDPNGIFNPAKIIDTPPMDTSLRTSPKDPTPEYETLFSFRTAGGIVRDAEKCSGVGECRKTHLMGGTMCPSYMATRSEKDTTRARANMLRDVLSRPRDKANPWNSAEVASVMDLCLSCKACKSECPSSVDVARMKAEWQQHQYDVHGVPLRSRMIANFGRSMRFAALAPGAYNALVESPVIGGLIKKVVGFAPKRSMPKLHSTTLSAWHRKNANPRGQGFPNGRVYLFCDEFTNFTDAEIGIAGVRLLNRLGYEVIIPHHVESGRAHLSKGLVRAARALAIRNVELLKDIVTRETPLIGIEPSAILGFRDEFPDLVPDKLVDAARALAGNALLFDEFIMREVDAGRITRDAFASKPLNIKLHGHCHQKALASLTLTKRMLELPEQYNVSVIPSGCCGMAGSFGYEKEHYAVSQQIGELVLFPAVRALSKETVIAAPGPSCRHQVKDATGRRALHPVEILHAALK
ncbi:MAG TPA: FAD-linked oxidase C-terminal domain-containing protein [Opitutaceae bacterium]|nr:FAD-linked oxidase C-terminal domain-containing protein [Opitutaceae bacterium]